MESPVDFKRMLLGLPHSATDYASVAFTAELAGLLGLDLVGIFAEDDRWTDLAALPCVREFRLSGDGWGRLDAAQLERAADCLASDARRLFGEAVKALRTAARFDFVKGQLAEAIGSQSTAGDIFVVIEPRNPAERVTHQFKQFMDTVLGGPAPALLVPSRISRRKGPVVVVAESEHDPSIRVGLSLAEAVQDRLIVLAPAGLDEAVPASSSITRRPMKSTRIGLPEIGSMLEFTRERLVVLSRGMGAAQASRLAFERGIPVLLTGDA